MTTSASALPALAPNDEGRKVVERVNALIRWFNRPDLFVPSYAADTGSGTAYVTAPSTDIKVYEIGQEFDFVAANANTSGAPTLSVNGLTAGTITYPDGSALLPGDIAANSFNKVGVTSTTPTFQLLSAAGGRSKLLQTVSTETGAVTTGTTTVPFDDTIPQNTEGDQYMSLAITPKSATSILIIDVVLCLASSVANNMIAAIFQDSAANAIAAMFQLEPQANSPVSLSFRHKMTSGTTSATTFKVRAGGNGAGTTTFNGALAGRLLGGVLASSIVIREVLP